MNRLDVVRLAQPPLRRFLPGVLFGILSAGSAVALLATSAFLITRAAEQPPILYLGMAMVGVRAFALGRAFFRYLERLSSHDAAFRALADLRVGVYERLIPRAPDGLARTRRGDLLSRLVSDIDDLQDFPLRVIQPLVIAIVVAVASTVVTWFILPAAGVTLLVCLVVAVTVGTWLNSGLASRADRELAPLRGALADRILDLITNLDVITAFGALESRLESVRRADDRLTRASLGRAAGAGAVSGLLVLLSGLAGFAALVVGVPALGQGGFDGPALAVVVLIPLAVFEVIAVVPLAVGAWQRVAASADRVANVVPEPLPAELPAELPADINADTDTGTSANSDPRDSAAGPSIELTGVAATWPGQSSPAISNVSFRVEPGDRLLIEGSSGSGKTTIAHVLVRFLEYSGNYTIDGVPASVLGGDEVRRVVGLCEQSPYLFDDSIRQNLLFARDAADDAELEAVLDRVGLADWLAERGGLSARVGERGGLVSGGQAQRIALARAILADFPVLVLDEPTANVDPDVADALLRDLLEATSDGRRSVILISHTAVPDDLVTARLRLS